MRADGTIAVTIRELRDPAGLQSRLRADGVPASVSFFGQQNPSCRPYPAGTSLRNNQWRDRTACSLSMTRFRSAGGPRFLTLGQ